MHHLFYYSSVSKLKATRPWRSNGWALTCPRVLDSMRVHPGGRHLNLTSSKKVIPIWQRSKVGSLVIKTCTDRSARRRGLQRMPRLVLDESPQHGTRTGTAAQPPETPQGPPATATQTANEIRPKKKRRFNPSPRSQAQIAVEYPALPRQRKARKTALDHLREAPISDEAKHEILKA